MSAPTLYDTPSGLGGTFTVSVIKSFPHEVVKVRVHYPTADWDGYTFMTTREKLTPVPA